MTQSRRAATPKTISPANAAAKPATAKPAGARATKRTALAVPALPPEPTHHHPNLGLAPADMTAGFPEAAEKLRGDSVRIAVHALQDAIERDPSIAARYDESARKSLLHDAETLTERLAMCVSSNDPRWLAEYAEWIGPIYRRRGVPLADLATLAEGIRTAASGLGSDATVARDKALDAAIEVLRKNGRLAGDRHKRNALLRWLYRGV